MVPGLKEGIALMTTGSKMRFWLPENLAFAGAAGKPKGPLMVEVVLLDVTPAPTTPADVAAPPADATKTKSGLAFKVLKPGTGTVQPEVGQQGHRALLRLDHGGADVRQLRAEGPAVHDSASTR